MTVPDVTGMTLAEARKVLTDCGLFYETDGETTLVSAQAPAAGATLRKGGSVMLYTYDQAPRQAVDLVRVPDVRGLSMVEAGRQLRARGMDMEIAGSGIAVRQMPPAGDYAPLNAVVTVTFELPQGTE